MQNKKESSGPRKGASRPLYSVYVKQRGTGPCWQAKQNNQPAQVLQTSRYPFISMTPMQPADIGHIRRPVHLLPYYTLYIYMFVSLLHYILSPRSAGPASLLSPLNLLHILYTNLSYLALCILYYTYIYIIALLQPHRAVINILVSFTMRRIHPFDNMREFQLWRGNKDISRNIYIRARPSIIPYGYESGWHKHFVTGGLRRIWTINFNNFINNIKWNHIK